MEPLFLTENTTNHDEEEGKNRAGNIVGLEGCEPDTVCKSRPLFGRRTKAGRAPSLQNLNIRDSSLQGVLVHQLMFAVRYSNFEQLRVKHDLQNAASDLVAMLRDVRPRRGGRVMLCDAVEL
ncbi:hypothetical protein B0H11DRAFT_773447 [Mycena galericulata]|nr:hypothetical protein B0H11DRAFT_773447 [Mycena galericulata]